MGLSTNQKFQQACTLLNRVVQELRETHPEAYLVASEGRLLAFTGAHLTERVLWECPIDTLEIEDWDV